jgi:hypothetical protein
MNKLPTAILVCEQHPISKIELNNFKGLGCWLSIVTSLSVFTIPDD